MVKLFLGPMSKNVVDAAIEYTNETQRPLGLIASRRQVDYSGGYVNYWNTKTLADYVRSKTQLITLQRDHGGPLQGEIKDPGFDSFYVDSKVMDIIHIDPWKENSFEKALGETVHYIRFCRSYGQVLFEIGTEEAIFPYSAQQLEDLIIYLKNNLKAFEYGQIKYAVIQSGTKLKDNHNTGVYSLERLQDMLAICRKYNLLSKEHNGDFLSTQQIKDKFAAGLHAINIAPEMGRIETNLILQHIKQAGREDLLDLFYQLCYKSGRWKKWVSQIPEKEEMIQITGHYLFSNRKFLVIREAFPDLDQEIKAAIKHKIKEILD